MGMETRYSFGGDDHIFVEVDEEMSLDAFFKSLSMTSAVRESRIKGVTEDLPGQRLLPDPFRPGPYQPPRHVGRTQDVSKSAAEKSDRTLSTRILEVSGLLQRSLAHETLMRFRERHQDPSGTDLEYAARINGYAGVPDFVQAHSGAPWFVSMVGFVAGLPFMYQMVEREKQIEVPNTCGRGPTRRSSRLATAAVSAASTRFAGPAAISFSASRRCPSMTPNRKCPTSRTS